MSTHALLGGKVRYAIVTLALVAVLGGVLVPTTAQALSLAELIDLFIALEIIPADKAAQARSIVAQEKTTPSTACPYTWTRSLTVGASGTDVKKLQEFLNGAEATRISNTGAGSPGNESIYFGSLTAAAVAKFQDIYKADVLTPVGLTKGTGYFGAGTRAKANELCTTGAVTGDTTSGVGGTIEDVPSVPMGTGLVVKKAATQPANAIVPEGAARVPFTKVELSAGAADVTVTGIAVRRTGTASNSGFAEVVLLDENGSFIGNPKTLNTDNEATLGGTFVVPKGATKTVTVAGNMAASLDAQSGEVPSLAVVAVNTASTVEGTFPIVGAQHTLNGSLAIGGVSSVNRGALDPGTGLDKTVGTTGYVFSSVKITANSDEDLLLKSIRWYQSESASAEDLANVKTIIDGVEYATVVNGRYYTTVFPGTGLSIKKGLSKDISIKGDIVAGSGRAVDFDIERNTDIHLVGTTYGYAVTPGFGLGGATDGSVFRTSNNPYYDASQVAISAGTMNVSGWTQVSAANVGTGILDTILGGLTVEVRGEPVTVGTSVFSVVLTNAGGTKAPDIEDLTNVVLTDESGALLAGPVDGSVAGLTGNISFSDSVTFPVGTTNVYVRGKLGSDFETNDTVTVSTNPGTQWMSVRGENTSATLTLADSNITNQPMTVRGGALTITVSSQPPAQNVIAGAQNFEFARYILDATQSSENIRMTTLPLHFVNVGGARTDLTSCKLYDGATALTTGGNVKNPAVGETPEATTFTFDNGGYIVPKGAVKSLSLKCNIKTGISGNTYTWGIDGGQQTAYSGASGISTGLTVDEQIVDGNGQTMTATNTGDYEVSEDTSLIYRLVQAGSTDVELARFRFSAGTDEDIILKKIALEYDDTTASSADLAGEKVSVWKGATKVGEAQFGGATANEAVATLSTPVTIPRGDSVTLSVRGDLAVHNSIEGTPGALLIVSYNGDANGLDGNYGTGAYSGITIAGTSGDVASNGVRIFRTMPQVEDVTPVNTILGAGSDLYQVKVTASNGRDTGIRSMTFNVTEVGTSLVVQNFQLWGPNGAVNATPVLDDTAGVLRIVFGDSALDRIVPANSSKTYRLRANTVSGLTANEVETLTVALRADTAYQTGSGDLMGTVAEIEGTNLSTEGNFIWTPFSTTIPQTGAGINSNDDWTNGYGVPGYPGVGQNMQVRVFSH